MGESSGPTGNAAPAGNTLDRESYLAAAAAGPIYAKWEAGAMKVRLSPEMAIVRYKARLEFPSGNAVTCWQTDSYEMREGQWQAVWSQATVLPKAQAARRARPAKQ